MPNALLARYFAARGLFRDLDFAAMEETQPEVLFNAWLALPDAQLHEMDTDFREILELSCEKGFRAILDEAEWHLTDAAASTAFVEKLAGLSNHFGRAILTFLDHKPFWKGASLFYHADCLPYWRKRKNLPHVQAAMDDESLCELARLILNYFHYRGARQELCGGAVPARRS